jgi:hypothetical protein
LEVKELYMTWNPSVVLTPVIPPTQEAEIRRIKVPSQSGEKLMRPYHKEQARHGGTHL